MKKTAWIWVIAGTLVVAGCVTRSISDSGYRGNHHYGGSRLYQGELSEFDVLGIDAGKDIAEAEIAEAFGREKTRLSLTRGEAILLIQSGAMMPDEQMRQYLEQYFSVSVFTGIPEKDRQENMSYAKALRYSAAKAGIGKVVVYWGILESGTKELPTKTISWVPIVGWGMPDEAQKMRIRLKLAIVDVVTGQWEIFSPEVFQDSAYSARGNRAASDQEQVIALKSMAYESAVKAMLARYMR